MPKRRYRSKAFGDALREYLREQTPRDIARLEREQPALPGAEDVRSLEVPTPAYDAPFSLTPKPAPAIPPRARRLFDSDHED